MTDVRPFRPCTSADIADVAARATEVARGWGRDWLGFGDGAAVNVACAAVEATVIDSLALSPTWWRCEGPGGSAWASAPQAGIVEALLFSADREVGSDGDSDALSVTVAQRALGALLQALAGAQAEQAPVPTTAPIHLGEPGRRALSLRLQFAGALLAVLLELRPVAQASTAARRDAVLRAQNAVAKQRVRVEVLLGESEVELGALRTLSVGDVLRLDKRLDEGVELRVGDQRLPCAGYLVAKDGGVAVEVARR
ncbi:MAG TPA: FliM/FliN family flagellar motor C-terminal domain-containing protein [Burkholderiaceae bacterium]|nr:FliM/FliN family flagellar motor C-terminal domain-containing protein [Burkholderiaceae bacterium]